MTETCTNIDLQKRLPVQIHPTTLEVNNARTLLLLIFLIRINKFKNVPVKAYIHMYIHTYIQTYQSAVLQQH